MQITDEEAKAIMNAVVIQAANDYRKALYCYNTVRSRGKKLEYKNMFFECELFFRKNLDAYCELNGEKILEKIRSEVRIKLARKGIIMKVPK